MQDEKHYREAFTPPYELPCSHMQNKGILICDIKGKICLIESGLPCETMQDEIKERAQEDKCVN